MYRNALSQAQRYVYDLNQKVEIFRQHDQSYLHTLISSGFSELKEIQQLLNSCLNKVEGLFKTGNISEATALAQWILDQKQRAPELSMVSKEEQEQIDDWQEKTRQLVINCTIAVSHVAEQNESISSNTIEQ